jgi:2,4-dienoyl-CoA reductase-like NADH-dependent reductase (Old Yellow Enzyme family)
MAQEILDRGDADLVAFERFLAANSDLRVWKPKSPKDL